MATCLSNNRRPVHNLCAIPPISMDLLVPPPPSPFVQRKRQRAFPSPLPPAPDYWDNLPRALNVGILATPDPALALQWSPACIPEVYNPSPMLAPTSPVKVKREFGFNYLPSNRRRVDREREQVRGEESSRETSVGLEEFGANASPGIFKTSASSGSFKTSLIPHEFSTVTQPAPADRSATWALSPHSIFTPPAVSQIATATPVSFPGKPAAPAPPKRVPSYAFSAVLPKRKRAISKPARTHACTQCTARFRMRGDLKRHVRTVHEGERSHVCADCGRSFGHSGHLNRHVASVHLNVRAHACAACGDRFFQASHLRSHIAHVHAAAARFGCPLCRSRLATEGGLRSHMRNVHGARDVLPCTVAGCPERFVLASDRERHVRRRHARD